MKLLDQNLQVGRLRYRVILKPSNGGREKIVNASEHLSIATFIADTYAEQNAGYTASVVDGASFNSPAVYSVTHPSRAERSNVIPLRV